MGKIIPDGDKITIEFDIDEIIRGRSYMKFPDKSLHWIDYIGNMIARWAWRVLYDKAPKYFTRYVGMLEHLETKVEGEGKIRVTFQQVEEQWEQQNLL